MSGNCQWLCLTPTKNEGWIINHFIRANERWASRLIVADQGSTDKTLDHLRGSTKVDLVINDSPIFDERHRQNLLINRARTYQGKRVLIALDADEVLSANCLASPEWKKIEQAKPGTVLRFKWVNVLPGLTRAWIPEEPTVFGFVDDGSEHKPKQIHSRRVPWPDGAPVMDLQDIVVLHFQYVLWERMESKQRWYQVWEYLNGADKKGPLQIYREYNHMQGSWDEKEIRDLRPEWIEGYVSSGVDFRTLVCEPVTWWDRELVRLMEEHGAERFRKLAIWNKDWQTVASEVGPTGSKLEDPRSLIEKAAHQLLLKTQGNRATWKARVLERCLRWAGW